jgi:hypothetical protein
MTEVRKVELVVGHRGRELADETGVHTHDTALAGHLVLAECHDPAQHGAGDGLVEDRLNATEGDDQTVLDDGATPLGHAGAVEMGSVLLNLATRQSGLPAHLRLGNGDALVLLLVGVVRRSVRDEDHVELAAGVGGREAHHDGAGELVGDTIFMSGVSRDRDDVPCLLTDGRGQSLVHVISLSSSGRSPNEC